jgi:hypothetical protein
MPWVWVLVLVVGFYVAVKSVQGIRDLVNWYIDGRAFDREQKKLKGQHVLRQASIPPLKEKTTSKPNVGPRRPPRIS